MSSVVHWSTNVHQSLCSFVTETYKLLLQRRSERSQALLCYHMHSSVMWYIRTYAPHQAMYIRTYAPHQAMYIRTYHHIRLCTYILMHHIRLCTYVLMHHIRLCTYVLITTSGYVHTYLCTTSGYVHTYLCTTSGYVHTYLSPHQAMYIHTYHHIGLCHCPPSSLCVPPVIKPPQ